MKRRTINSVAAIGLACLWLPVAAQNSIQLASWTFEHGYTATSIDDRNMLYTPNTDAAEDVTQWFSSVTPHILPTECEGETGEFVLSASSPGRYWSFTGGYNTRIFRIENTESISVSDFTDPSQHQVYYEVSFPTKGYKGISVAYAIAPGNNTVTPVEMVISTDGGNTWFDAGAENTSGAWFQYQDNVVSISANDKEQVIVRLLPTSGTTNWNLKYLTLSASEKIEDTVVSETGATLTWAIDRGAESPTTAISSAGEVFSFAEFSYGSNLTVKGTRTDGGISATMFQPITGQNSENNDANALIFSIKPKNGLTLRLKEFSFQASKVGTNGGKYNVGVTVGGTETIVKENVNPQLVKNPPYFTAEKIDLSDLGEITGEVYIKIYIQALANDRQYAFQNFVLTGDINGTIQPVPTYTFSMKPAIAGAGSLSCSPAGAEFDEGTRLTVSATENFGYHFTSWSDETGAILSTDNPYSFEIANNTKLVANYSQNNVYALRLNIEGGANTNQIQFAPEGNVVDGIHYYEEGTDVQLTAINNRILTFNNWDDNTTAPVRMVRMNSEKQVSARFSAEDYIVGWDFYFDQPNSERAADYKDESDNAGLFSLRDADGHTSTWLTRGISNGAENGKWGARIWRKLSEKYYFEMSFSSVGYSGLILAASLGVSYNTYSTIQVQYSIDGSTFETFGSYQLQNGWTTKEIALPAEAAGQTRVWIRFMPDYESGLVGNTSDYDGLCLSELFVLADKDSANDDTPPALVHIVPADQSTGASAQGSIILTFDEKINIGSGDARLNGVTLTPKLSGKSVVYNYSGLGYATRHTFTVPAGAIVDRSGNAFEGITISFTTMERTQPEARLFDAIVAQDGTGDHSTVQSAIDAAPADRVKPWLIFVKNGQYNEHVEIPENKPMLHIIGQDRDKTVILDDKLCGGDNALHVSVGATVVVKSNDCFFENITLENSYGHELQQGPQALALNTIGDRTIFNNVAMLSYQDTWITPSASNYRAYVRNSLIEGAVDFIYNSGNIYIENTTLYINRKSGGFIVAPSHAADVLWGYVFNHCTITAPGVPSETSVWLGRPWHNFPKTVFINTRAEVTIPATGWYETMGGLPAIWADWNTTDAQGNLLDLSQRRDTYYYTDASGEKIYGTAKNRLTDEEAAEYTVSNVLSGDDNWEPVIKTEACEAPVATIDDNRISWQAVPYAICYLITRGDEVVGFTQSIFMDYDEPLSDSADDNLYIQAVNEFGGLSPKAKVRPNQSTAVTDSRQDAEPISTDYYDMQGRRIGSPTTGLHIVVKTFASGKTSIEKVMVR